MIKLSQNLKFDSPNLAETLDNLTADQINQLPFGVLKINYDGKVELYSQTEAEQSGYGKTRTLPIGLNFYLELAPCMNTAEFRGQIEQAARHGKVDFECGHTGDYGDRFRSYQVRIMSAASGGFWQVHDRTKTMPKQNAER